MTVRLHGKWCLGHGVIDQAESLRLGHYVEMHLVDTVFATRDGDARAIKGFGRTLQPRCNLCRSILRWHDNGANALRRARTWRREHAERWVKNGRADTVENALTEMAIGGITDEAIAGIIVAAIGELCPGLCAYEQNGKIYRHTINRVNELHVDVRNPGDPLTLENIGVLCVSCNTSKGDTSWGVFIFGRRAALKAWQDAIDNPDYRRGAQQLIPGII